MNLTIFPSISPNQMNILKNLITWIYMWRCNKWDIRHFARAWFAGMPDM